MDVNQLLCGSGYLVHQSVEEDTQYVVVRYPLDSEGSVDLYVDCARRGTHGLWSIEATLWNNRENPARKLDLLDFLGANLEPKNDQRLIVVIDPFLKESDQYKASQNMVNMMVPRSGLGWLGSLLHEFGHVPQFHERENSLMAVWEFRKRLDILYRNTERFRPEVLNPFLENEAKILATWDDALEVFV
jgi:hypothetical protein